MSLSKFEEVLTTHDVITDCLLSHLVSSSVFTLHSTSSYLRKFLRSYPLAWKTLSFRLQQPISSIPTPAITAVGTAGAPTNQEALHERNYAIDLLVYIIHLPIANRLTNLDLCNTTVHGQTLMGKVFGKCFDTLQHLSVRGCKNVSLKYHINPFLQVYKLSRRHFSTEPPLALKSLYTYRCRHHRRRPYLPASLTRRDSDSEPTHELIELCRVLGIWTDTAWCPTPGPRCFRRKDYHLTRSSLGHTEVWVPFDRLWRSSNRIGPPPERHHSANSHSSPAPRVGKLWEENDYGEDGEPLGIPGGYFKGDGRHVPNHERKSHLDYVQGIKCDDCGLSIVERCETCSIKMHCMACRKTLCSSCAFNKPYNRQSPQALLAWSLANKTQDLPKQPDRYWWAPGAKRSPNIMIDAPEDDDYDTDFPMFRNLNFDPTAAPTITLELGFKWCCLEPVFSGGGGMALPSNALGASCDRFRAVPLPKVKRYLDPEFPPALALISSTSASSSSSSSSSSLDSPLLSSHDREMLGRLDDTLSSNVDILTYLKKNPPHTTHGATCPRSLCSSCYNSVRWKVSCKACKTALCKEHDFAALKLRKCGYRDLHDESEYVHHPPKHVQILNADHPWPRKYDIPPFRRSGSSDKQPSEDERQARSSAQETNSTEESDSVSAHDGSGSRDPSSAPHLEPNSASSSTNTSSGPNSGASYDHATSSFHSPLAIEFDELETEGKNFTPRPASPVNKTILIPRARSASMSDFHSMKPIPIGYNKGKNRLFMRSLTRDQFLVPCAPGHPVQWKGCGAYYCPAIRHMGDGRPRCSATGKDCIECGVFVCEDCVAKRNLNPGRTCTCSFCSASFHCPSCVFKPAIVAQCLREAEEKAKLLEQQQLALAQTQNVSQTRQDADAIVQWGSEFWGAVGSNRNLSVNVNNGNVTTRGNNVTIAGGGAASLHVVVRSNPTVNDQSTFTVSARPYAYLIPHVPQVPGHIVPPAPSPQLMLSPPLPPDPQTTSLPILTGDNIPAAHTSSNLPPALNTTVATSQMDPSGSFTSVTLGSMRGTDMDNVSGMTDDQEEQDEDEQEELMSMDYAEEEQEEQEEESTIENDNDDDDDDGDETDTGSEDAARTIDQHSGS